MDSYVILRHCIYSVTMAHLSIKQKLHQLDLEGDMLKTDQGSLSVHHCKIRYNLVVIGKIRVIVNVCGKCFIQR